MALKSEWIRYGEETGYLAFPERAARPLPAVIVIQEVGGVNNQIEEVTRRIAAAGYAALAPDLFAVNFERPPALSKERIGTAMAFMHRLPPGAFGNPALRDAELATMPKDEAERIRETMAQIWGSSASERTEGFMAKLKAAVRHLRQERPETRDRKVGCVGFCMGGGLSALLACEEPAISAAAIYYGSAPAAEKVARIGCPVIAFYGEKDQRINAGIPGLVEAMRSAGKFFDHHIYAGANHAFFNDDSPTYDVAASRDSFARLLMFFSQHLV